jgi:hypothetical protein
VAPHLANWFDKFRQRRSMLETQPAETPQEPDIEEHLTGSRVGGGMLL